MLTLKGDLLLNRYLKSITLWIALVVMLTSCLASKEPISSNTEVSQPITNSSEDNTTSNSDVPAVETETFEQKVDQMMADSKFSGSVLVVKNDQVILSKGYNMSDYSAKLANGPDTIHQIGSLSKAFTAAAILQLQEAGELDLQDPVQNYIDYVPNKDVTLYHLLTHTSGIPNYTNSAAFLAFMDTAMTVEELVDLFIELPLEFEPGSEFAYSNSGYVLLGAVIEKVSGLSYSDYLQQYLFEPLEMTRSGYLNKDNHTTNVALGYMTANEEAPVLAEPVDVSVAYAAGGIYSTVEDLYKWTLGLENGTVLSEASWKAMRTPNLSQYGLGWGISDPDQMFYNHAGQINGFSSFIGRDMNLGMEIIILSNDETAPTGRLAELLFNMLKSEEV